MFYLSEDPSPPITPPHPPPPLHTVYEYMYTLYIILIHTGKGGGGEELSREKVRGAIVHKAGRKYQHD
jgi:hypothetical protein